MLNNLRRIGGGGLRAGGLLGLVLVVCERTVAAINDACRVEKRVELEDKYAHDFYGIKHFMGIDISKNVRFIEREFDPDMDRYWRRKYDDFAEKPAEVRSVAHDILSRL